MIQLRDNQVPAVDIGLRYFREKSPKPAIIVAPTAYGKSIVISTIAHQLKENVLVLQPSKELLKQNYQKLLDLGGQASIFSASMKSKEIGEITYATIGSIKSLGSKFKSLGFKKVIIDECHLYPREPKGMLRKFLSDTGIKYVLGFTATPLKLQTNSDIKGNTFSKLVMLTNRSKKGTFFSDILYVEQIENMLTNNYWCKFLYDIQKFDDSSLEFNSTKAEYTEESLRGSYEEQSIEQKIVDYIVNSDRKSILVGVPSVQNAIDLSRKIPNSVAVYGDMPKDKRDRAIDGFKNLSIRVAINVNVLSVGFDHQELDCIISGRATASLAYWYQFLGRLSRVHPNKKDGLIVDFAGNTKRFGRIEELYFRKEDGQWKLYGENNNLLTGIPMHEIGKHTEYTEEVKRKEEKAKKLPGKVIFTFGKYSGKSVSEAPEYYLKWLLKEFSFNKYNSYIKDEIERILN